MNFLAFGLLLSTLLWSLAYARTLALIYLAVLAAYAATILRRRKRSLRSHRPKIKAAGWNHTGDPSVFSRVEVDLTPIDALLERRKKEGKPISYTAVFARAMGEGLSVSNKIHGNIRFGQYFPHQQVNFTVVMRVKDPRGPAHFQLTDCNSHGIAELEGFIRSKLAAFDAGTGTPLPFSQHTHLISKLPSFMIQVLMRLSTWLAYDVGVNIPAIGLRKNHYGLGMLVDASDSGVEDINLPLVGIMKTVSVAVIAAPRERAAVVDGAPAIRKTVNFCLTYDHRFGDGVDAMLMLAGINRVFENPENYL